MRVFDFEDFQKRRGVEGAPDSRGCVLLPGKLDREIHASAMAADFVECVIFIK
jgi:hypothetical protein